MAGRMQKGVPNVLGASGACITASNGGGGAWGGAALLYAPAPPMTSCPMRTSMAGDEPGSYRRLTPTFSVPSSSDDEGSDGSEGHDGLGEDVRHSDPVRAVVQGRLRQLQQQLLRSQQDARERMQEELSAIQEQLAAQLQEASIAVQAKQVGIVCVSECVLRAPACAGLNQC